MQCPRCHHKNDADANFCTECGTTLNATCPACGATIAPAAKFCSRCGVAVGHSRGSRAERASEEARDERRWATLVFADLSGFTAVSESLDPEDVKALANQCTQRLGEEVRRFGGVVLNVAGDQIFAAFGAPTTHEDDAERAVRAALAMRDCALEHPAGHTLKVHIGVNTGEVMAGLIGPKERQDYTAMGDATNVAARLMSAAPPGTVLVGEETWRATRRIVRYRELPPVSVKGKERPVAVWEALAAANLAEARPLAGAPLMGRDHELSLLSEIWLKVVREARPQLITVIGEPGIGKSRIVADLNGNIVRAPFDCMDGACLTGRHWAIGRWPAC